MAKKVDKTKYYLGNPNLPAAETPIAFEPWMISELEKSKDSILHFAENYFYIINLDEGRIKIKLHDCQKRVIEKMTLNRFFILLASRQVGKALALDTPVPTPDGWKTMGELKDGDRVYGLDGNPCNVIKAHDTLYNRKCYKVIFDNGEEIIADSEHLWFTETNHEQSVKTTQQIYNTINLEHRIPKCKNEGYHTIERVVSVPTQPVRCISVDSEDNLFLVGNHYIPTHNSTIMTIYILWYACFRNDQRILLVANKEATAIEIFQRVRMAFEELPVWLKPGVVEYGKTSMVLDNGSRIGITTTTGTAARGQSVNLLIIDEMSFIECIGPDTTIKLRNKKTGEVIETSIENARDIIQKT
jgi:intein/homing endonuclease